VKKIIIAVVTQKSRQSSFEARNIQNFLGEEKRGKKGREREDQR